MTDATTQDSSGGEEVSDLPARLSAKDRHLRNHDAGLHPHIGVDDGYWELKREELDNRPHWYKDGDALIGLLRENRCPVCGETGYLTLRSRYTFVRGAYYRRRVTNEETGEKEWKYSDAIEKMEDNGTKPIACRAGGSDYLIAVASPDAVTEYEEWKEMGDARRKFRSNVRELRGEQFQEDRLKSEYGKGHLMVAIFEELGMMDVDEREYIDRRNITKGQLHALLDRVRALNFEERRDYNEEDWMAHRDFGIHQGRVEFHTPEWAGFKGLNYSDHYRQKVFDKDE